MYKNKLFNIFKIILIQTFVYLSIFSCLSNTDDKNSVSIDTTSISGTNTIKDIGTIALTIKALESDDVNITEQKEVYEFHADKFHQLSRTRNCKNSL